MTPSIIFIVAEDFNQLPPVDDRVSRCREFDYYNSPALFELCSGTILELTKCRRSDDICFNKVHPNNINNLSASEFGNKFTKRHLCFTNKKRIAINKQLMDSEVGRKK